MLTPNRAPPHGDRSTGPHSVGPDPAPPRGPRRDNPPQWISVATWPRSPPARARPRTATASSWGLGFPPRTTGGHGLSSAAASPQCDPCRFALPLPALSGLSRAWLSLWLA